VSPLLALAGREVADDAERLALANVMTQLEHLTAHPSVARRVADGSLQLHGMYFHVAEAQAYMLDPATGVFTAVAAEPAASGPDGAAHDITATGGDAGRDTVAEATADPSAPGTKPPGGPAPEAPEAPESEVFATKV
jgi:carbonic anhydrase